MLDDEDEVNIFQEPSDYYKPEKPSSFQTIKLANGKDITIRLIGFNPLWGHHLWNGARVVTCYLLTHAPRLINGKTVLELGAGAGLPSLVCASNGARKVVVTDYPDADLIDNINHNIEICAHLPTPSNIVAQGYLWGAPVQDLTLHRTGSQEGPGAVEGRFDVVILADLLFNHSEHRKLLQTVRLTLARTAEARALVFFTPYRPWLLEKDLAFFEVARKNHSSDQPGESTGHNVEEDMNPEFGVLEVKKVLEEVMEKVMFEKDRGDEMLRRTVFGYELMWKDLQP